MCLVGAPSPLYEDKEMELNTAPCCRGSILSSLGTHVV